jgi:flagellar hook-associated protein 3 FlgL
MRITSEVMVTRSLDRLQTRLQAYERAHSELGTGKRILVPSDDPAGARRAMSLRGALQTHERNLDNISDAAGWLDAADSQLQSALDRLGRVRELTVRGATDGNAIERAALAAEIEQIGEELRGIANARHLGRPLFGGFGAGDAVDVTPGPPATYTFNGTADQVTRRVSETELVRVNVTAGEWLQGGGTDLFTVLDGLVAELRTGTPAGVGGYLDVLSGAHDRIAASLADIGAATNRVDSARARAEAQSLTVRTELSNVEDVNIAQGVMELQVQQVAYEATLQALAKALPPSLVAFLR